MTISQLQNMLDSIRRQNGDLQVYCGPRPIGALVLLPARVPYGDEKVLSFVPRELPAERHDRRSKP
jgi:hypothetical protein